VTLLTGPLILLLVALTLLAGVLIALTLLAGALIALTLLAGALPATLLSGVLSALILLAGILIGLVRIFRIVHRNVSLPIIPTYHPSRSVPPFLWKVVRKESAGKQDDFTSPLLASSAATSKMEHAEKYGRWT
jgi:hypothetical protein